MGCRPTSSTPWTSTARSAAWTRSSPTSPCGGRRAPSRASSWSTTRFSMPTPGTAAWRPCGIRACGTTSTRGCSTLPGGLYPRAPRRGRNGPPCPSCTSGPTRPSRRSTPSGSITRAAAPVWRRSFPRIVSTCSRPRPRTRPSRSWLTAGGGSRTPIWSRSAGRPGSWGDRPGTRRGSESTVRPVWPVARPPRARLPAHLPAVRDPEHGRG